MAKKKRSKLKKWLILAPVLFVLGGVTGIAAFTWLWYSHFESAVLLAENRQQLIDKPAWWSGTKRSVTRIELWYDTDDRDVDILLEHPNVRSIEFDGPSCNISPQRWVELTELDELNSISIKRSSLDAKTLRAFVRSPTMYSISVHDVSLKPSSLDPSSKLSGKAPSEREGIVTVSYSELSTIPVEFITVLLGEFAPARVSIYSSRVSSEVKVALLNNARLTDLTLRDCDEGAEELKAEFHEFRPEVEVLVLRTQESNSPR